MVTAMGSLIRWIAILASVIVALGFLAFAVDEMDRGSKEQQNELADGLKDLDPEDAAAIGSARPRLPRRGTRPGARARRRSARRSTT